MCGEVAGKADPCPTQSGAVRTGYGGLSRCGLFSCLSALVCVCVSYSCLTVSVMDTKLLKERIVCFYVFMYVCLLCIVMFVCLCTFDLFMFLRVKNVCL